MKLARLAPALAAFFLFAGYAEAAYTVSPGQEVFFPTPDANPFGNATLAVPATNFAAFSGGPVTLTEAVYGEAGGTLDFAFQLRNNGTQTINSIYLTTFRGFQTTLGYTTDAVPGFAAGTTGISRLSNAARPGIFDVYFEFTGGLMPGATSVVFFVKTDATNFGSLGQVLTFGSNSLFVRTFQPASVPEPSSLALLGLAGLAGLGSRRFRVRRAA